MFLFNRTNIISNFRLYKFLIKWKIQKYSKMEKSLSLLPLYSLFLKKNKHISLSLSLSHFLSLKFEIQRLIFGFSSTFGNYLPPTRKYSTILHPNHRLLTQISSYLFIEPSNLQASPKCSWLGNSFSPSSIFWNHSRWVHTPTFSCFLQVLGGEYKLKHQQHN